MTYELWWRDSLNITAVFRTEPEALAALREAIRQHGREYAAQFSLERLAKNGDREPVAAGPALVALAERAAGSANGAAPADRPARAKTAGRRA